MLKKNDSLKIEWMIKCSKITIENSGEMNQSIFKINLLTLFWSFKNLWYYLIKHTLCIIIKENKIPSERSRGVLVSVFAIDMGGQHIVANLTDKKVDDILHTILKNKKYSLLDEGHQNIYRHC